MSLSPTPREGYNALTLPLVPVGSILGPITFATQPRRRYVDPSPLDRAKPILDNHNRHVALVDHPGNEEQWRLSLNVIKLCKELNEIAQKARRESNDKIDELQAAVHKLSESIAVDARAVREGYWSGELIAMSMARHSR